MSVAFRRESDEEHLEPKFEIPIPPGPNFVTPRGKAILAQKAEAVRTAIEEAATDEERDRLKRDLRYWDTRLTTAEIAPSPAEGEAGIGSRVTFMMGGKKRSIAIVGHDEADPASGLIAFSAPLARALIGGAVGETAPFNGVADALEILDIEVAEGSLAP
ncbi:MAG: GreA/GreB family elongation factor [Sphingobium phenoxybenzoativorans]